MARRGSLDEVFGEVADGRDDHDTDEEERQPERRDERRDRADQDLRQDGEQGGRTEQDKDRDTGAPGRPTVDVGPVFRPHRRGGVGELIDERQAIADDEDDPLESFEAPEFHMDFLAESTETADGDPVAF